MAKNKLTHKRELFANYYVECGGNASEAYRRAYAAEKMTDKQIWEEASKLMNNPKVAQRVKELQSEIKEKSNLSKKRVLNELEAIMDARITDYVTLETIEVCKPMTLTEILEADELGTPPETEWKQVLRFKDFTELTDRQVKAIESVKEGRNGIELKLHGKSWTIERICKMLGYDAPDKIAQTDTDGNPVGNAPVEHVVTFRDFSKKE